MPVWRLAYSLRIMDELVPVFICPVQCCSFPDLQSFSKVVAHLKARHSECESFRCHIRASEGQKYRSIPADAYPPLPRGSREVLFEGSCCIESSIIQEVCAQNIDESCDEGRRTMEVCVRDANLLYVKLREHHSLLIAKAKVIMGDIIRQRIYVSSESALFSLLSSFILLHNKSCRIVEFRTYLPVV